MNNENSYDDFETSQRWYTELSALVEEHGTPSQAIALDSVYNLVNQFNKAKQQIEELSEIQKRLIVIFNLHVSTKFEDETLYIVFNPIRVFNAYEKAYYNYEQKINERIKNNNLSLVDYVTCENQIIVKPSDKCSMVHSIIETVEKTFNIDLLDIYNNVKFPRTSLRSLRGCSKYFYHLDDAGFDPIKDNRRIM